MGSSPPGAPPIAWSRPHMCRNAEARVPRPVAAKPGAAVEVVGISYGKRVRLNADLENSIACSEGTSLARCLQSVKRTICWSGGQRRRQRESRYVTGDLVEALTLPALRPFGGATTYSLLGFGVAPWRATLGRSFSRTTARAYPRSSSSRCEGHLALQDHLWRTSHD